MTATPLLKPHLYAAGEAGPVLLGGRCACGYIFFPMQRFGCEHCGRDGDALEPHVLRGTGTLVTSTRVHLHADARRRAPFTVGVIALDDGPIVRTLLDVGTQDVQPNARMRAVLASVQSESGEKLDLYFKPSAASP